MVWALEWHPVSQRGGDLPFSFASFPPWYILKLTKNKLGCNKTENVLRERGEEAVRDGANLCDDSSPLLTTVFICLVFWAVMGGPGFRVEHPFSRGNSCGFQGPRESTAWWHLCAYLNLKGIPPFSIWAGSFSKYLKTNQWLNCIWSTVSITGWSSSSATGVFKSCKN